jgi:hypothetical protein
LESEWAGNPRLVGSNPTLSAAVSDQGSGFEWRRKRGRLNKALERVEDAPWNLLTRRGHLTDSAKRKLYEHGIEGQAEILDAPGEHWVSEVHENIGRFRVRVEIPGREPYEVQVTQSFGSGYEYAGLQKGALIECRVDPEDEKRVLLVAPEPDEQRMTVMDSSQILAKGDRATGTIVDARDLEVTAPGTKDPMFLLNLELRSESEAKPWKVEIGQRVPEGAHKMIEPGSELTVAYLEVDEGDSVAVDWPGSTEGRFT